MNFFEDLQLVYKKAGKDTLLKIKKAPHFLIFPFIYGVVYMLGMVLIGKLFARSYGTIIGFIIPLLTSLILSSYFSVLSDLIYYNRISFRNFSKTFMAYFASIYSVFFILMIISFFMPGIGVMMGATTLVGAVITLALNPIAESIYIRGEYYTSAYTHSLEFMKENFLLWTIPFLIYLGILHLLGFDFAFMIVSNSIVDIPLGQEIMTGLSYTNPLDPQNIKILLASIITAVYAIFRGNLYRILVGSTRRKRAYMGEL
ncbi:Uncharacterised protein [Peptoniphilus harei]|uniref:hypothetical protein n=1 Tax=Peptoniphilus harei TaxID=54005 RepID=UPI000F6E519F|nr:hypothetical protein [Peptoniphilus harei]MDU6099120.1 hypothetical protein [Peptoniphilus harei]QQE47108.1 hypothetical protein I6H69_01175 [Peptoniphilus harei]VEJ34545.1 Uncharacterised protein [Peptoniphilus harei]